MSRWTLLFRTLLFHWRTNVAVGLGVVAGTAVIGGALIVGDSVRGSLRDMTLARLGPIDIALTAPRFFREDLAALLQSTGNAPHCVPAIIAQGTFEKRSADGLRVETRAGRVNVIGLDERLWRIFDREQPGPQADEVFLSSRLARELEAGKGDSVFAAIEIPGDIPRDTLLGKRDETSLSIPFRVEAVLGEDSHAGRFGLRADQQLPLNAFVSLKTFQERLGLAGRAPSRRDPRELLPRVNSILVYGLEGSVGESLVAKAKHLDRLLSDVSRLDDFHARMTIDEKFGYLSLESDRMILDKPIAEAGKNAARQLGCKISPVLAYVANEIRVSENTREPPVANRAPQYSRYSIVAGIDPELFAPNTGPPFGPFQFTSRDAPPRLGPNEFEGPPGIGQIIINDWLAEDLGVHVGDILDLTWHVVGSHGELPEDSRGFRVHGIVRLDDTVAADRGLVPEVHGITDVSTFDEWDAPFPMKPVTKRDDAYWAKHRATPKAFIPLDTAKYLWGSRYGNLTSLRIAPVPEKSLEESKTLLSQAILKELNPAELGLSFQPVKYQQLQASSGSTDFGGLFIGFSFFLIVSAMILIGLLFRLGMERRAANVGLLLATGYSPGQVRRLLMTEGLLVVAAGGFAGVLAAVGYAALIIHGLKTWWIGAIGTRFLELHIAPSSLTTGFLIAGVAALISIWWGVRGMWRLSPRGLLSGVTNVSQPVHVQRRRGARAFRVAHGLALLSAAATAAVIFRIAPDREAFGGFSWPTILFFLVGLSTLAAGLVYLSAWVDSDRAAAVRGSGLAGVCRLGARNAARHRSRSILSTGLVASAAFLIVAIAAGHRNPAVEQPDRSSGNGGFTLVADSTIPVLYDLNTPEGRAKLQLDDEESAKVLAPVTETIAFRVNPGENASCLNIYQTSQPTILGVPSEMIERGGFKFVGAKEPNPWRVLRESVGDDAIDDTIPVIGDINTLQYSLHVGPGQTLAIRSENGAPIRLKIAGMLDSSVFQGVLLMDEKQFQKHFPSRVGYQYFLVEVPPAAATAVSDLLESKLPGFDAERVVDRLASFLAVQNTYLSTFQALGGLGLLLGTIGLSTVMLRNVLERRGELALMRAVGFRDALLGWLVLCENALLLVWGLATGTASALVAMLPHLVSTGADVPWRQVALIVAAVFVAGMLGALVAVRGALRTPVLTTLRAE